MNGIEDHRERVTKLLHAPMRFIISIIALHSHIELVAFKSMSKQKTHEAAHKKRCEKSLSIVR